jgi:tagaturonate reductase
VRVRSVRRALSTATDWDEVRRVFVEEAEVVLSNTGDKGYALTVGDDLQGVPTSFPMKLLALLQARYQSGGRALTILPCELISRNGEVLQALVLRLAAEHAPDTSFQSWLSTDVVIRWSTGSSLSRSSRRAPLRSLMRFGRSSSSRGWSCRALIPPSCPCRT